MKNNSKKGFTLVELVIVIAVIAILAAVLIPTFSHIIDRAKDSAALQTAMNALKIVLAADEDAKLGDNTKIYLMNGEDDVARAYNYDGHELEEIPERALPQSAGDAQILTHEELDDLPADVKVYAMGYKSVDVGPVDTTTANQS